MDPAEHSLSEHSLSKHSRANDETVDRTTSLGAAAGETSWVQKRRERCQRDPKLEEIAGFSIEGEAHRGGQAVVYRGIDPRTGRRVALKLRHAGATEADATLERFERELQAVARLQHPNIVTVLGVEDFEGRPVLVFEWVDGRPCNVWSRSAPRGRRSESEILDVVLEICAALQHAHGRGILHRDLKPTNILVSDDGKVKLVDFGVVKFADNAPSQLELTQTRDFVGTPRYASPEQLGVRSGAYTVRSEVYSLALILFEMLTGEMPYDVGSSLADVVRAVESDAPRRLVDSDPRAPRELDTILRKAMSGDPERRYASIDAFAADLERYRSGQPISALPPSALYQLRKIAARNPATAALAVFATLLTLSFAVFVFFQNAELRRQGKELNDKQRTLVEQAAELRQHGEAMEREKAIAEAAHVDADRARRDVEATFEVLERVLDRLRHVSEDGVDEAVADAVGECEALRPASRARVRLRLGQLLLSFHRPVSALREFERCVEILEALEREPLPGAERASPALLVAAHRHVADAARRLARYAVATRHLRAAIVLAETHEVSPLEVLQLRVLLADSHTSSGDFVEAKAELRRARAMEASEHAVLWPSIDLVVARVRSRTGAAQSSRVYDKARAAAEQRYGPESLEVAAVLEEMAVLDLRRGHVERGRAHRARVAEIFDKLGRASNARRMHNDAMLAELDFGVGRDVDAAELSRRAASLEREFTRAEDPAVLAALSAVGVALAHVGELDEGLRYVAAASSLYDERVGVENEIHCNLLVHHAQTRLRWVQAAEREGRADASEIARELVEVFELAERALDIRERRMPGHADTSHALNALGAAARMRGDLEASERYYTRAIALLDASYPRTHVAHYVTRQNLLLTVRDASPGNYERVLAINTELLDIVRGAADRVRPQERYPPFYVQAESLFGLRRYADCLRASEEALALAPDEVPPSWRDAHLRLETMRCISMAKAGRWKDAQAAWRAAREQVRSSRSPIVVREFEACGAKIDETVAARRAARAEDAADGARPGAREPAAVGAAKGALRAPPGDG